MHIGLELMVFLANSSVDRSVLQDSFDWGKEDNTRTNSIERRRGSFDMSQQIEHVKHVAPEIRKSPEDRREYQFYELDNGLKLLVVSDLSSSKSAACFNLGSGSMSDPPDLEGLAHAFEHVCTMGSEKYREETKYESFIGAHGGHCNAVTSTDQTIWYFDIESDFLIGALDILTEYFVSPLLDKQSIDREMKNVDSEHEQSKSDDGWRTQRMERHLSKDKHDYAKFGTGNNKTLVMDAASNGIDLEKSLRGYFEKFVSADRMTVCIVGQKSVDELSRNVIPILARIRNKQLGPPKTWLEHPYGREQLGIKVEIVSVQNLQVMIVLFPIVDADLKSSKLTPSPDASLETSRPDEYVSYLLNDESEHGLIHSLKEDGWITGMKAFLKKSARGFGFYAIRVHLTDDGLKKTDDILESIFDYIAFMRKPNGPRDSVQRELSHTKSVQFRNKIHDDAVEYAKALAKNLREYAVEYVLQGPYLMLEFRADIIRSFLEKLAANNFLYVVISKDAEGRTSLVEEFYEINYQKTTIDASLLRRLNRTAPIKEYQYPSKNDFIPADFSIIPSDDSKTSVEPRLLFEQNAIKVWYGRDVSIDQKRAVFIRFWSSSLMESYAKQYASCKLLVYLYNRSVVGIVQKAGAAGSNIEIKHDGNGFVLKIAGYLDKQDTLLEKTIEKLRSLSVVEKQFQEAKSTYIKKIKSFENRGAISKADYFVDKLLIEKAFPMEELSTVLEGLTVDQLKHFIRRFVDTIQIEVLVYGNCNKESATNVFNAISKVFKLSERVASQTPMDRRREIKLAEGSDSFFQCENTLDRNSVLQSIYQIGIDEYRTRLLAEILSDLISEPLFAQLRTKEQIGYDLSCEIRRGRGCVSIKFVILSSKKAPDYVESRLDAFLAAFEEQLMAMASTTFDVCKTLMRSKRLLRYSVAAQAEIYWEEVMEQSYDFGRAQSEWTELQFLTKEDFEKFYKNTFSPDSQKRRQLSVLIRSAKTREMFEYEKEMQQAVSAKGRREISDPFEFNRNANEFYSLPSAK